LLDLNYKILAIKLTAEWKKTIFLMVVLHFSTLCFGQKISLIEKNVPLKKVFEQINSQTGFGFFYDINDIKNINIDVNLNQASLDEALNQCLRDQPLIYKIVGKTIVVQAANNNHPLVYVKQPPILINGEVYGEENQPLPNVTVTVKGSNQVTFTDNKGNFRINVPKDRDTLFFSYIGFASQALAIGNDRFFRVNLMAQKNGLDEVVVTALNIKREQIQVGYAITQISGDEVATAREPTFIDALAGKVAGLVVQTPPNGPGGSSRIILRGNSSFSGSNQPLYVVDGVPINSNTRENTDDEAKVYGGVDPGDGLSSINPDDIESISILKGASASALYGGGAQSGVILITTKKAKKRQPTSVSFNSNTVWEKMIPYDHLQTEFGRGFYGRAYTITDINNPIYGLLNNSGDASGWSWGAKIEGQPFIDIDGKTKPYVAQTAAENFDRFFRVGLTATNSIAISKGYDNGAYRLSFSDTEDDLPMKNEGYEKYNGTLNIVQDFGKKLHVSFKVDLSRTLRLNAPLLRGDLRGAFGQIYPRIANTTNITLLDEKDAAGNFLSTYYSNPYVQVEKVSTNQSQDRALSLGNVSYDINDHLHLNFIGGLDYLNSKAVFGVFPNNVVNNSGYYQSTVDDQHRTDLRATLNYNAKFNKIKIDALAGAETQIVNQHQVVLSGADFIQPTTLAYDNLRTYYDSGDYHTPRYKTNSVFATGQLGYGNFLFLELTARNDWYSALSTNRPDFKNYLFYPSANLSFVFTNVLKIDPQVLSMGKLRVSKGETGSNPAPNLVDPTFTITGNANGLPSAQITGGVIAPARLQPETTTETEVGTELKFFGDQFLIDFDYYYKQTQNLLIPEQISSATTYHSVYVNAGNMYNKGVEFLLSGSPVKSNKFSWNISFNAAFNKNKVTALDPSSNPAGIDFYYNIFAKAGYPLGSIFGSSYQRAPNGQVVYQPENSETGDSGTPNSVIIAKNTNYTYLGSVNPDWSGGIGNTFTYKSFSFSFLIDGQFGGKIFENGAKWTNYFGNSDASLLGRDQVYIPDGVIKTATGYVKNTLPYSAFIQFNDNGSADKTIDESLVFSRTFIKLRQVILAYKVPEFILKKTFIKTATASLIGRNLFYLRKDLPTFDPESSDSIGQGFGFDSGGLPVSRTYGFNLNINF
jgi:TonB-linked SusC/RagA family outer membrane protein